MNLSSDLISQFVKATNDKANSKSETIVYGTVSIHDGRVYVKIDGSDGTLTPITTTTNVKDGDRVTVMIKDHTATITGNITSPAINTTDIDDVETKASNALTIATEANNNVQAAKDAASSAQTKATEALTAANNAKTSATNAETLAKAASTEATEASSKADAAQAKANLVESNLEDVNDEIYSIKEDATQLRSDLEDEIEAVETEMSKTYAKKTELSSTETTLRSEISQSAAEIQETVEQTYAKTTYVDDAIVNVETNLQTQITQNADSITSLAKSIEAIEVDVTDQNGKISEAQAAAESAQATADAAKQDATQAQTAADSAQAAADTANTAASTAQAAADAAKADLATAQAKLSEVESDVNSTKEDIEAAQAAVQTAQTAADNAQAAADNAASSAANAQTAADNAQTKANEASTAAANAQAAADEAKEDLEALEKRVTIAETAIEQNSEAITLRATKTELAAVASSAETAQNTADGVKADLASNYYTKSQTESLISVESDSIKSSVSATYATKDALADTNTNVTNAQAAADAAQSDVADLDERVISAESSITQLSDKITANVSETTNLGTRMTTVEQTATSLTARIDTAEDDISTAQSTADTAKANAATAQSTANAAKKQLYHSADGTAGTTGYVGFCTIVVKSNYVNRPILFELNNRGKQSSNVSFCFKNVAGTDPDLSHLQYDGGINVWAYKSDTSTWQLIAQKSEGYDTIYVKDFTNNNGSVTVTWADTHYDSLPTSNITAGTLLAGKIEKSVVDNAAKTATNYLSFSSAGLVVGDMTADTLGKNVLIDSDSVDIRNGSTTLASFGATQITLGQNAEDSSIDLCDGAGTISTRTSEASTSWPKRNAILIDSQEIETESVRFVASTSNTYGETSTPDIQRGTELYMIRSSGSESCARLKAEHKTTSSGAYTNSGISAMTYDAASTTRAMVYASDSANSNYNQVNVYPTKTTMSKNLVLNGTTFTGKNKVLWSGGYYMSDTQTATLSEAISDQANGIVLIWSYYVDGATDNSNFQMTYIPKHFITLHAGKGVAAVLTNGTMNVLASKYVYISDTSIKGYAGNDDAATEKTSGVTSTAKYFILRYVIGV